MLKKERWFKDVALWALLIPAAGYGVVYLFRVGQASVWRYPLGLISFGPTDLALAGVIAVGVLLCALFFALVVDHSPSERLQLTAVVGVLLMYSYLGAHFEFIPANVDRGLTVVILLLWLVSLAWLSLRRWVIGLFGMSAKTGAEAPASLWHPSKGQLVAAVFVVVLASVGAWAFMTGQATARNQTAYYVYEGAVNPGDRWVILADSNDRLILGLSRGSKLLGEYRVVPTTDSSVTIGLKETGVLTPPSKLTP
jgi:hypothetical protein